MKNNYKLGLAAFAASLALVGCGGGSSSSEIESVTGNLYNTYVEGANYVCSSGKTGITDKMGTYTCNVGDTVEFFLGNFSIGSADAADGILDTDLLSSDDTADTDLLQLLQGIDDESDGVITIPDNFTDLDALVDLNVNLGDSGFETAIASETDITLVDETTAVNNHAENLLQAYLAGKTYYVIDDVNKVITHYSYNADLTSVTFEYELLGENIDLPQPGTNTVFTRDGKLVYSNGDYDTFAEKTEDYILINEFAADGSKYGVGILYTEAYYDTYKAAVAAEAPAVEQAVLLKTMLAGNTWVNSTGMALTFNADVTIVSILDAGSSTPFNDNITLNGMTITHSDGTDTITIVDDTTLIFDDGTGNPETFTLQSASVLTPPPPITEELLAGKTFYSYEQDTDFNGVVLEDIYAKMTFSGGTVSRTEVINVFSGDVIVESFTDTSDVPYTIIDGKIRADIPAFDGDPAEYGWITLLSENTDSWSILDQGDNYQDGTIDWTENTTWYLSKPTEYPASL